MMKGSRAEPVIPVQDIAVQSQALLNVKDSNKVSRKFLIAEAF